MTTRRDPRNVLLTALGHEVGNLLAAVRLSAHLLPHAAEARERARGARQIEQLAAQAGELLAQVRPLLAPVRAHRALAPLEVLESVTRALGDAPGAERLALKPPVRALPDVRVDPDALLHALLALSRAALESSGESGRVSLGARRSDRHVLFEIEDTGKLDPPARNALPRGRALTLRLTDAVLGRDGGRVSARARRGSTLVVVAVRAVAARKKR